MEQFKQLYIATCKLDEIYIQRYKENEKQFFEKNCISLLVELGEFTNETRCFKYWSIKKPNRELMLEELADCIIFSLQLIQFEDEEIDFTNFPIAKPIDDPIILLNELFLMGSCLMHNEDKMLFRQVFVSLVQLGNLFEFTDQEIIDACYKKIEICKKRLNSDY